jgi:hypothetical protein
MLVTSSGSKTSTPSSQENKDNRIPSSPCVTPIGKSDLQLNATKREAIVQIVKLEAQSTAKREVTGTPLPDVVVLDEENKVSVTR